MNKYILISLCALSMNSMMAQKAEESKPTILNFNSARNYFATIESQIIFSGIHRDPRLFGKKTPYVQRNLMSPQALNIFMAKKVNTYLSGSSDLSLYKGYFIVDPTDGKLFIGYNYANDPSNGVRRTKAIHNFGFKSNIAETFSTIYNGEDKKLQNELGFAYKFTILGRGIISYDSISQEQLKNTYKIKKTSKKLEQGQIAEYQRIRLKNKIYAIMYKDSMEYTKSIEGIDPTSVYRATLDTAFYKSKNKEFRKLYITEEADFIDNEENYNQYWNHWLSFNLFVPVTTTEYKVATDFISKVEIKSLYSYDITLLYNHILERKCVKWFGNLTFGIKNLNNVKTEQIEKYSFNDYVKRTITSPDTFILSQFKSQDVYVGNYISEPTAYFNFQIVSLFIASKSIGLSAMVEKFTGNYHPLNLKFGLPFALKGKDEETKANFEIQFKLNDFDNSLFPDKQRKDKLIIGLSVGIPLTSKIY